MAQAGAAADHPMKTKKWPKEDVAIFAACAILIVWIFVIERCPCENNADWSRECWTRWKIEHWDRDGPGWFDDQ